MITKAQLVDPIPTIRGIEGWMNVPINDNDEELVSVESLRCSRIAVRPAYFQAGVRGSIPNQYVRTTVGELLERAAELLPEPLILVILDAWRPLEVQEHLHRKAMGQFTKRFDQNPSDYAAKPSQSTNSPYPHSTGGAVDVTLMNKSDSLLNMGTAFDEFSPAAATRFYEVMDVEKSSGNRTLNAEARENRRILFHVMTTVGFTNYCKEWWHFDFGDQLWAVQRGAKACYGRTQPNLQAHGHQQTLLKTK